MTAKHCVQTRLTPELIDRLTPSTTSALPKVRQLYLNLYTAIETGELADGFKLPSSRDLALQLGLGRNTVITVYEQLCSETVLSSDGRRGTQVSRKPLSKGTKTTNRWPTSMRARQIQPLGTPHLTLAPGAPDTSLFPTKAWRRAQSRAAALATDHLGYLNQPLPELQKAIARFLATYRSLIVDPDQIIITASTRQSLLLAATLFADSGDEAWIESPGYRGAVDAFTQQGLLVTACPVDEEGMVLPRTTFGGNNNGCPPRIVYLTPCFQYPLGMPLSANRRDALLTLSRQHGTVLFEDDYDSEFRDNAQPHPALASQSKGARVLHAGTFSKLLFPAVRLGWLVVPHDNIPEAQACLRALGGGNNTIAQAAVLDLLLQGDISRHLQRARQIYGQRRKTLIKALEQCEFLPDSTFAGGGLNLVLPLIKPVPLITLENALSEASLGVIPLERMKMLPRSQRTCSAIVIGLGNVQTLALPEVMTRLDAAIATAGSKQQAKKHKQ